MPPSRPDPLTLCSSLHFVTAVTRLPVQEPLEDIFVNYLQTTDTLILSLCFCLQTNQKQIFMFLAGAAAYCVTGSVHARQTGREEGRPRLNEPEGALDDEQGDN